MVICHQQLMSFNSFGRVVFILFNCFLIVFNLSVLHVLGLIYLIVADFMNKKKLYFENLQPPELAQRVSEQVISHNIFSKVYYIH